MSGSTKHTLTRSQARTLQAIIDHTESTGKPPTFRELGRALDMSAMGGAFPCDDFEGQRLHCPRTLRIPKHARYRRAGGGEMTELDLLDAKGDYLPTLEEIARETARIREQWTEEEFAFRRSGCHLRGSKLFRQRHCARCGCLVRVRTRGLYCGPCRLLNDRDYQQNKRAAKRQAVTT